MSAEGREGEMNRKTPMTRAELELAVRAELVDIGASSWQARLAADYILAALDNYLQAQADHTETRLREIIDFYLQAQATAGRRADPALAHWIAEDCHRALCHDKSHTHEETPWSSALSHRT